MNKKIKLVALAFVGALALASCTKDYNCVCSSTSYPTGKQTVATYTKVKKADAKTSCTSSQNTIKLVMSDVTCTAEAK
jgi:hypothetical protein